MRAAAGKAGRPLSFELVPIARDAHQIWVRQTGNGRFHPIRRRSVPGSVRGLRRTVKIVGSCVMIR
jgi:hypothetical protein